MANKKKCSKCKELLPFSSFKYRKEGRLNLQSGCIECMRIYSLNKNYTKPVSLESETWKDIPLYEGIYQVSNLGRIKSLDKLVKHKNGTQRVIRSIILKQISDKGYYTIRLSNNYNHLYTGCHRLVAKAFIPNPENKPCVNHINGIKTDNRVENLEWCTYSENEKHSYNVLKKTRRKGELSNSCKLTEQVVLAIRRLHRMNPKYDRKIVAKKLNMHSNSLNDITRRKSWKHI